MGKTNSKFIHCVLELPSSNKTYKLKLKNEEVIETDTYFFFRPFRKIKTTNQLVRVKIFVNGKLKDLFTIPLTCPYDSIVNNKKMKYYTKANVLDKSAACVKFNESNKIYEVSFIKNSRLVQEWIKDKDYY